MAMIVVEVVSPTKETVETTGTTSIVEVVRGASQPIETVSNLSVVEVVKPGGTVVNAQFGAELPEDPYEGQIFLVISS
jgi:hypothetical protein